MRFAPKTERIRSGDWRLDRYLTDEFSPRSFPYYPGGTSRQRWHRELLREAMEAEGFAVYPAEWWHFDYGDWRRFRIGNSTFEELTGH